VSPVWVKLVAAPLASSVPLLQVAAGVPAVPTTSL